MDPAIATAPSLTRVSAVRLVQEGLTNATKHAGPDARVTVTVELRDTTLRATVHNTQPTRIPSPLPESGHGLAGIRERVALLGGSVTAGPSEERGWQLSAEWPLEEQR